MISCDQSPLALGKESKQGPNGAVINSSLASPRAVSQQRGSREAFHTPIDTACLSPCSLHPHPPLLHAHPGLLLCQHLQLRDPFPLAAREGEDDIPIGVMEITPSTQTAVVAVLSHRVPHGSWRGGEGNCWTKKGEFSSHISKGRICPSAPMKGRTLRVIAFLQNTFIKRTYLI